VDSDAEDIAVREAKKIGIPVVAIIDTNCDPDPIDYLVPANDDAIRSIHFIVNEIADAIEEGRKMYDGIKVRTPVREKEETESKPEGVVVEEINIEEKKTGETAEETAKDKETTEEGEATEEKETPGAGETSREATESEPAVEPEQEPEQEEELSVDEAGDIKLSDTDK
jgi:small subunit ribosomal protein S2